LFCGVRIDGVSISESFLSDIVVHTTKAGALRNSTAVVFCIADLAILEDSLTVLSVHFAKVASSPQVSGRGSHAFGTAVGATSDSGTVFTTVVYGERV
jgi:hypothetical protein